MRQQAPTFGLSIATESTLFVARCDESLKSRDDSPAKDLAHDVPNA
jgi:hypothetical protein